MRLGSSFTIILNSRFHICMTSDSYGILSPSFARPRQARRSSLSSVPVSPPRPEPTMTPRKSVRGPAQRQIVTSDLEYLMNKFFSDDIIRELLTGAYKECEPYTSPNRRASTAETVKRSPAPKVRARSPTVSPSPPKRAKVVESMESSSSSEDELPVRVNPRRAREKAAAAIAKPTLVRTAMRPRRQVSPQRSAATKKPGRPASRAAPKRK